MLKFYLKFVHVVLLLSLYSNIPSLFADESLKENRKHEWHGDSAEERSRKMEVVELPVSKFPHPNCTYSVHQRDKQGPKISTRVIIGEQLFHRWQCHWLGTQRSEMYCMMVHNCVVSTTPTKSAINKDQQNQIQIIDEFGCSLYPLILPHVDYEGDLDAGLTINAFSLDIDQPAIFFKCNVRLLLKVNGICRRPQCVPTRVYKDAINARMPEDEE